MGYVDEVLDIVSKKNADQPEFLQAVTEVLESLRPVVEANEEFTERTLFLKELRARSSDYVQSSLGR